MCAIWGSLGPLKAFEVSKLMSFKWVEKHNIEARVIYKFLISFISQICENLLLRKSLKI